LTIFTYYCNYEKQYIKYFDITEKAKNRIIAKAKENVISETKSQYGYFALISNDVKNPIKALEIYRNKVLIEKGFENK
jgi:hypothetical protein